MKRSIFWIVLNLLCVAWMISDGHAIAAAFNAFVAGLWFANLVVEIADA